MDPGLVKPEVIAAENGPFQPFLLPAQGSTLDRSQVPCLKDCSDTGKLRYSEEVLEFKHLNLFKNHVERVHGVKLRA
jgi:hypothetical protein